MVRKLLRKAYNYKKNEETYKSINYRTFPKKNLNTRLSGEQKKEVDCKWGKYSFKPSYKWHELYCDVNGVFDASYVPTDAFYMNIVGKLNNRRLVTAWEDKSQYLSRFPDVNFPHTVINCINGHFYDDQLQNIEIDQVMDIIQRYSRLLVKPSFDSGVGRGVEIFDSQSITAQELVVVVNKRGNNCVIQEVIKQHEMLASFNESSVNMIRINCLRVNGKSQFLNATLRFGSPGYITDVAMNSDGTEIVNLVGVKKDGTLMDAIYDGKGNKRPLESVNKSLIGKKLPQFEKAIEICQSVHNRLTHFDIVAFDITYDSLENVVIIEFNLGNPGIVNYQYIHGPFFGKYTEYLLEELAKIS